MIQFKFFLALSLLTSWVSAGPNSSGGSFVKPTKSYRQADVSEVRTLSSDKTKAHAWRGERVNLQLLLWAGDSDLIASVSASDLLGDNGKKISAKNVNLDFLKFIQMNTRDGYVKDPSHVESVPDMLNGSRPATIKAGHLQPLWVGVNIPRSVRSGIYKGNISVKLGSKKHQYHYQVEVLDIKVPEVKDWSFDLSLWTHPQATLHYYNGCKGKGLVEAGRKHIGCKKKMWSDQHLALYKPTLELLRDAGLKTVTVNLIKDPWRSAYKIKEEQHQTNYSYDEMIHWRRKADGSFTFDFTHFEKYVKFCMDLGVDQKIDCFSMLPWINHSKFSAVTCYDEASKKQIIYHFKSWEEYNTVWTTFMKEWAPLLIKNGWFEKTRIGVDERGLKHIPHVLKILKNFTHKGKTIGLVSAANRVHHFDDSVDHISMHGGSGSLANNKWSDDHFAKWAEGRRKKGLSSSWYTCTGTYPGNFGNSRPAESLFIGWYSARIQADGYLRWAVDSWNDNPTLTTDHKMFETGDTFQIYPGDRKAEVPFTRSSVRFELLRQGIVDYEKIRVLKARFPETKKPLEVMLAKISRPKTLTRVKGQSSFIYEKSTAEDFSVMLEVAQKELLKITKQALK